MAAIDNQLKVIIYSCITGGYELPIQNHKINNNYEYLFFTDGNHSQACEQFQKNFITDSTKITFDIENDLLNIFDSKDRNRFVKMHPQLFLPPHDLSIYVDGDIQITGNLNNLIQEVMASKESIFLYEHHKRKCTYEEALFCADQSLEFIWKIYSQMKRYRIENYPQNNGLYEGNIIFRKNTNKTQKLMESWWKEYYYGAKRDQLSLVYCSSNIKIPICSLGKCEIRKPGSEFYLDMNKRKRKLNLSFFITKIVNYFLIRFFSLKQFIQ